MAPDRSPIHSVTRLVNPAAQQVKTELSPTGKYSPDRVKPDRLLSAKALSDRFSRSVRLLSAKLRNKEPHKDRFSPGAKLLRDRRPSDNHPSGKPRRDRCPNGRLRRDKLRNSGLLSAVAKTLGSTVVDRR